MSSGMCCLGPDGLKGGDHGVLEVLGGGVGGVQQCDDFGAVFL
jgi:hypothetical protein